MAGTEGRKEGTHRVCVGAVCAEGQGNGRIEDAELADHLLHAADGALLVRVCKLDHQAGRGTLGEERIGASLRREGRLRLTSRFANGTSTPNKENCVYAVGTGLLHGRTVVVNVKRSFLLLLLILKQ